MKNSGEVVSEVISEIEEKNAIKITGFKKNKLKTRCSKIFLL